MPEFNKSQTLVLDFFKQIKKQINNFETRNPQIAMSINIINSYEQGKTLVVEAPTGVGKSWAYLIPSVVDYSVNKKRTLIVTSNITLQEQIVQKDLPFISGIAKDLDISFSYALAKGKNNFLCNIKYNKNCGELFYDTEVKQVQEWAKTTQTGDLQEITFPIALPWSCQGKECAGKNCSYNDSCFAQNAFANARNSDIVVTNYHLFFANRLAFNMILGEFDNIVFDEVHNMADIARDFYGCQITKGRFEYLLRYVEKEDDKQRIRKNIEKEWDKITSQIGKSSSKNILFNGKYSEIKIDFTRCFTLIKDVLACKSSDEDEEKMLKNASENLKEDLRLFEKEDENVIRYCEKNDKSIKFIAKLLFPAQNVSSIFLENNCVLTSATITTRKKEGSEFSYIATELGLPEDTTYLKLPYIFDYSKNAMVIPCSQSIDPNSPDFIPYISYQMKNIIESVGGKTLCLFTSFKNMKAVAEYLRANISYNILVQGDKPKMQLINEFKQDKESVLLGVASFWEGIDVPGDSLSCVIIDKLPFATPDDPVLMYIQKINNQWFFDYSMPRAILNLKQGIGRLIRTSTDKGIVAVLDYRFDKANYSGMILGSLPQMQKANIAEIKGFLNS